jgi:tRNA pseudouridine13 synthase
LQTSSDEPTAEGPALTRPLPGLPGEAARHLELPVEREGNLSLRLEEDDFVVAEVPLYLEAGEGEHLYLHVEKRNLSTPALVRLVCRHYRLREQEVGYAGRKDARGVTRQRISVPARAVEGREHELESLGEVKLLSALRHKNKLRLGHLNGNRFEIRLVGVLDVEELRARAALLERDGCPSYFGQQRFGRGDESLREAEAFVGRRRPSRGRKESFLVSIVQSSLFNAWLDERLRAGLFLTAIDGDLLAKEKTGAPFWSDEPEVDTPRILAREVGVTGPLWGAKMRGPVRESLTFESRSAEGLGVNLPVLLQHPAFQVGARRPARMLAEDVTLEEAEGGARLCFTLPPGAYATVFLRELCGPRLRDAALEDL